MLFDNNDMGLDYTFLDLADINNNMNKKMYKDDLNLFTSKEGLLRGNMFKDEYKPYKNLTFVNIKPNNDRDAKMYTVMQYAFAINDLNLYLDTHPDNLDALNTLEMLIKEEEKAKNEYISMYGPLNVCDTVGNEFNWIDSPWSWENLGGNKYV